MQEYNSPEEYIKDVQRYIRWSRAKVVATRELSDHINDQYDALRENGLNQKEAMRKAIEEMGDADVVGTELDIVHRPKVNWLLLLIAGVLLLSGILISAMLTSISLTVPKIIGIVLGVCVAAFLYFIDYTVLIRFPRALYGLLSLAAIFGLLYELWNGFAPLGYGFLFYLLLCYPIVLVGILFYEKNSESETKIIHYWLYAIFPLTLALINQAFPVFVLLLACELFIFCCGLKLKWLKWNRVNIFGVACMLIFLIIGVYLLSRFYHLFRLQENTGYLQQLDFFSVFREAELIGKSGMPVDVKVMSYFYDHPITLLLYEYGKFSLVFFAVCIRDIVCYPLQDFKKAGYRGWQTSNQYRAVDLYFTNCFHCLIRHWGSSELLYVRPLRCNRRNVHYLRYGTCWNYPISKPQ